MAAESPRVRVPSASDLAAARAAVAQHLSPTPLINANGVERLCLKLETFQPTGSFKVRGAIAAFALAPEPRALVTASAGNHALGMAFAALRLGRSVTVVVPETVSAAKLAALEGFPVSRRLHGQSFDDAEKHALTLVEEDSAYVSAYNDARVIAGQSTLGAELEVEFGSRPLTVVCAVGGGGLCAGLALWAASRAGTRVVGVEAQASVAVSAAVTAGRIEEVDVQPTIADGLAGNIEPGSITPRILADAGVELVAVSEAEIRCAMRWLFVRHGLVVEGAGAVATAAVLAGKVEANDGVTVAIVSGRNIAPSTFRDFVLVGDAA